jgi:hypothetical protein
MDPASNISSRSRTYGIFQATSQGWPFFGVPSMFDSLEVKVLYPT